jgi:hypothetical protein
MCLLSKPSYLSVQYCKIAHHVFEIYAPFLSLRSKLMGPAYLCLRFYSPKLAFASVSSIFSYSLLSLAFPSTLPMFLSPVSGNTERSQTELCDHVSKLLSIFFGMQRSEYISKNFHKCFWLSWHRIWYFVYDCNRPIGVHNTKNTYT